MVCVWGGGGERRDEEGVYVKQIAHTLPPQQSLVEGTPGVEWDGDGGGEEKCSRLHTAVSSAGERRIVAGQSWAVQTHTTHTHTCTHAHEHAG
jgi:hypothetical protein